MNKLKRVTVKEELVELTNFIQAITLDFFLKRSEFIDIFKTSKRNIYNKTMLDNIVSFKRFEKNFYEIIDKNYIHKKNSNQYKLNLNKIASDLEELGYNLSGFNTNIDKTNFEKKKEKRKKEKSIYKIARENGFELTKANKDYLDKLAITFTEKNVKFALYECGIRNNTKPVYIKAILKNWKKRGKVELSKGNPFYKEKYKKNKDKSNLNIEELKEKGWN